MRPEIAYTALILLLYTSCRDTGRCTAVREQIRLHIDLLSITKEKDNDASYGDIMDSLNESLHTLAGSLAHQDAFRDCDLSLPGFSGLLSDDKRLCIFSWDTKMGGTMIDFTNTIIYSGNTRSYAKKLLAGDPGTFADHSKIYFDSLVTYTNLSGEQIYIAKGSGRAASFMLFRVLKAFMIRDSVLTESVPVFPGNESEYWLSYDGNHYEEGDEAGDFIILPGREILVPLMKENDWPSGQYDTLIFDGRRFRNL